MYKYSIKAMPGQKAKSEGDTSVKYQIRRVNTELTASKKGHTEVIRTGLEYDEALKLIEGFNELEGKSQNFRDEAARRKGTE